MIRVDDPESFEAGAPLVELRFEGDGYRGSLAGVQLQPRDIAAELYAAGPLWTDALVLIEGVMVTLAESQGYDRAFNDNTASIGFVATGAKVRNAETYELYEIVSKGPDGVTVFNALGQTETLPNEADVVVSRDVGLMEINIPAEAIGTATETQLYDVQNNVNAGYALYSSRKWQPWSSWNSRICFRDTYVKRAARGVGNFLGHYALVQPADGAAKPRYLADPVLDYTYRLGGALHYAGVALGELRKLRPLLTSPANQDLVLEVEKAEAAALGFKTADHPWDYTG